MSSSWKGFSEQEFSRYGNALFDLYWEHRASVIAPPLVFSVESDLDRWLRFIDSYRGHCHVVCRLWRCSERACREVALWVMRRSGFLVRARSSFDQISS